MLMLPLVSDSYNNYNVLECLRLCMTLAWCVSLVVGIVALVRIKKGHVGIKGKSGAKFGIWASAIPIILFVLLPFIGLATMLYSERFQECDPAPIIATIEKQFGLELPEKMQFVRAAEADNVGKDRIYLFILSFITDESGWKCFRESFPKSLDATNMVYMEAEPNKYADEIYGFEEFDSNAYDPRTEYVVPGVPEWHTRKLKKGKTRIQSIISKNSRMQINTVCVDLGSTEEIVVYIEGWGHYYPGYSLRYINPLNPTVVPDNPESVRWLLGRFADKMRVKFPPETTLINARQVRALSGKANVKIEIRRELLGEFIEGSAFSNESLRDGKRFCVDDANLPWWDPEAPRSYRSAEVHASDTEVVRILVGLDDPNSAVVYLEWQEI